MNFKNKSKGILKNILFVFLLLVTFTTIACKGKDHKPSIDPDDNITAQKVEISCPVKSLYISEEVTITAKILPDKAKGNILWSTRSDKTDYEVASFDNGKLKALGEGSIYITAYLESDHSIYDTVQVKVYHKLLEEEDYNATQIIGALGEDASTQFNIHYSIKNIKSYALITKASDPNFTSAKAYYGEGYYFADLDPLLMGPFEPRNVWNIVATGLEENTEYIYKINNGDDTYSDVYHFKTAGKGSKTSFLFLTDNHYSLLDDEKYPAYISETTIKKALEANPNISFVVGGGDLIDTGGDENIWNKYFSQAESLKQLPFIGVPGNHEYYVNGTGQRTNSYFAAHSAGPLNGVSDKLGSSCWFMHNETLFIMVDNIKNNSYYEQYEWIENLLATKEYTYSIIVQHIPINYQNTDYDENMLKLYEKYGVDLVLSGHYHSQGVSLYRYNNQGTGTPYLGTSYFTGSCAGAKSWHSGNIEDFARGYMVDIDDNNITIRCIFASGNISQTWTIEKKRGQEYQEKSKEELLNNIKWNLDEENNKLNISWPDSFYGNVKKIEILETLREELKDYEVCPTNKYLGMSIENVVPGYDYRFLITVTFKDGSKESINCDYLLHAPMDLKVSDVTGNSANVSFTPFDGSFKFIVKKIKIYVNGTLVTDSNYLNKLTPITSYSISDLKSSTEYEIKVVATDLQGLEFFSETITFKTSK